MIFFKKLLWNIAFPISSTENVLGLSQALLTFLYQIGWYFYDIAFYRKHVKIIFQKYDIAFDFEL